jgi:hypothetical protein
MQIAFKHMPRFIIGVMHVEGCRSASAPFVETKRPSGC